jgi:hypothetical protein
MDLVLHIADRFLIHLASGTSLVMCALFGIAYLRRRVANSQPWIPPQFNYQLLICALLISAIAFVREPFDVYNGQPRIKAVTDFISWVLATSLGAWGLYSVRTRKFWT